MSLPISGDAIVQVVHDAYSVNARTGADPLCSYAHLVCGSYVNTVWLYCVRKIDSRQVAEAFGYTPEELQSIPADAHMGLGCGNPVAGASLREVRELEVQCQSTKRELFTGRDCSRLGIRRWHWYFPGSIQNWSQWTGYRARHVFCMRWVFVFVFIE